VNGDNGGQGATPGQAGLPCGGRARGPGSDRPVGVPGRPPCKAARERAAAGPQATPAARPADSTQAVTVSLAPAVTTGGPFRREGLITRILPFALVAALGELSLALPPGPTSAVTTALSAILLAAAGLAIAFLPWHRLPGALDVLPPLFYTASLLPLILASGGPNSGVSAVLLVPLIWTTLFHRAWESGCVVAGILVVMLVASLIPHPASDSVILRRIVFWAALATVIAVATHGLRGRISRSQEATARLQGRLREVSILQDRDRIASNLQDTVVQRLFAAGLSLQGIRVISGAPEVSQRIEDVVRNLDEAIRLLRQSIFGLEQGLPEQGLRRSILDVTSELTPVLGVAPEVSLEGPIDTAVPAEVTGPLLGALREALSHSGAKARANRVAITVSAGPSELSLTVTDNGSRWHARDSDGGTQLARLRARAVRLGGSCDLSAADGNTRLVWRIPLTAPGAGGPAAP
jgi:signal transduction histidine kinase